MTMCADEFNRQREDIQQPTAFGQRTGAADGTQRYACGLYRAYPVSLLAAAWSWLLYKYSGEEQVGAILQTRDAPREISPLIVDFRQREIPVSQWLSSVGNAAGRPVSQRVDPDLFSSLLTVGKVRPLPEVTQKMALVLDVQDDRLTLTATNGQLDIHQLWRIARDLASLLEGLTTGRWERLKQIRLSAPVEPLPDEIFTAPFNDELLNQLMRPSRQEQIAVRFQRQTLRYRELMQRVAGIQRFMDENGIEAGQRVGLHLSRHPDTLAAILACLFSQVAFVPLEPDFPAERLQAIQQEAQLAAVLQDEKTVDTLTFSCPGLLLSALPTGRNIRLVRERGPETPAYMMFTSGSTGKPKGVVIGQRALQTFLHASVSRLALSSKVHWLLVTTLAFDISMLELLAPLWVGGVLHLTTHQEYKDPQAVLSYLQQHPEINHMQATPAFWRMLFKAGWQGKRDLVALCGGEALDFSLAQRLSQHSQSLWNCYGPTEATVWSQMARIDELALENQHIVPLGHTLFGYRHLVVDADLHPLGEGMVGELCILGGALSSGYWLRDDLTADRFIVQAESGQRMYRTGDKVRLLSGDRYQYLGRFDDQVKLRGFRIELGEIEAQLKRVEQVQDAAVKLQGEGDEAVLVGYIELKPGTDVSKLILRKQLHRFLPAYMVPGRLVMLDRLPKTGSGKVDRKRLADV
ncbi:amino acid adenylation domain-containing protein [Brenneria rubrifaciens]|uniref:Amino acid adenylation domain-containing protein n=1 Tax=Brenneria rubrifaciens TaxID=55213 RepID=A0A4P8QVL7_9GAMM|nr:amino acid adenylation domain-containing protein [Brenneria rubrifaciens]QCR07404.1 amino acid adenylation domain-containing protein [Brenneria rubrifaciens]